MINAYDAGKAIVVMHDFTVLLDAEHRDFFELRAHLGRFAELVKTPGRMHTYRLTPLSIWNAQASGLSMQDIHSFLHNQSKCEVPSAVKRDLMKWQTRFGQFALQQSSHGLLLTGSNREAFARLTSMKEIVSMLEAEPDLQRQQARIKVKERGAIKQAFLRLGYPIQDMAGYTAGEQVQMNWKANAKQLRDYQHQAIAAYLPQADARPEQADGILVLPCGSGKTMLGVAAMMKLQTATLILTSSHISVQQWKREIIENTDLSEAIIGEYSGREKQVKPITIATYQMLAYRSSKEAEYVHMELFHRRNWGFIIYDEVHLLPAPVFRATAGIQATRRLGLTATLVREDGLAEDVFSLIGPKRYELPWKELEQAGWLAHVQCTEITVPMWQKQRYLQLSRRDKQRFASENPQKLDALEQLLQEHADQQTLIIGQYIAQLKQIASTFNIPLIHGKLSQQGRAELYQQFRNKQIQRLVVSKVANFAVDLPDASVAIQVSGSFGSRQEEAQRLGRILRPKADNQAYYYSLITADSTEQKFALKRQLFLMEQGYNYLRKHFS